MRKQLVIARGLPPQRVAQQVGVDRNQKQSGLPEEVLPCGFRHLRRGGKMNEAVADIVGAALVHALPLGLAPGRSRTDFIDDTHWPGVLLEASNLLGFSPEVADRIDGIAALQGPLSGSCRAVAGFLSASCQPLA